MGIIQISFVGMCAFCFVLSTYITQAGSYMGIKCPILDAVVKGDVEEVSDESCVGCCM